MVKNPSYTRMYVGGAKVPSPYILVPCGKCNQCLKERRLVWLFRLYQESLHSIATYFVTLTFDDTKTLPFLLKEDLQLLFKRLRKQGFEFKYYAIGEFGSEKGRPHYHIVFFSKNKTQLEYYEEITRIWKYGFVDMSVCNQRRLNYILHYHVRPKTNKSQPNQKAFQLISNGLGLQFITSEVLENIKKSCNNIVEDIEGRTISLPRYYKKKFDIPSKEGMDYKQKEFWTLQEFARKYGKDEFQILKEYKRLDNIIKTKFDSKEL